MEADIKRLQGLWRQVRFEENGIVDPIDTHGSPDAVMTIAGETFHVAIPGSETLIEGKFNIDSSASPKCIDWIDSIGSDAGKKLPAIYTLGDDVFEFAAADAEMQRPQDFTGGSGITIRGFVRI
ncbi:TIGR03067 domain-containing protein [uncultured Agrobacterium sp.]|uniref:TIGR03067 domain-containing protein n=1 Tax=uncultured Agrobacterium sp. TaxID=157277 RepID=UPI002586F0B2|nr:TIGR03067 domain-containing protein [uncultured Agrobacterium sp.]